MAWQWLLLEHSCHAFIFWSLLDRLLGSPVISADHSGRNARGYRVHSTTWFYSSPLSMSCREFWAASVAPISALLPSLLPCSPGLALQMFQGPSNVSDLSEVLCVRVEILIGLYCSTCCNFEGRVQGDHSHHHASDVTGKLFSICSLSISKIWNPGDKGQTVIFIEKKNEYQQTNAAHTRAVQGSTIVCVDVKNHLTLSDVILAWWLHYKKKRL